MPLGNQSGHGIRIPSRLGSHVLLRADSRASESGAGIASVYQSHGPGLELGLLRCFRVMPVGRDDAKLHPSPGHCTRVAETSYPSLMDPDPASEPPALSFLPVANRVLEPRPPGAAHRPTAARRSCRHCECGLTLAPRRAAYRTARRCLAGVSGPAPAGVERACPPPARSAAARQQAVLRRGGRDAGTREPFRASASRRKLWAPPQRGSRATLSGPAPAPPAAHRRGAARRRGPRSPEDPRARGAGAKGPEARQVQQARLSNLTRKHHSHQNPSPGPGSLGSEPESARSGGRAVARNGGTCLSSDMPPRPCRDIRAPRSEGGGGGPGPGPAGECPPVRFPPRAENRARWRCRLRRGGQPEGAALAQRSLARAAGPCGRAL